MPKGKPSPLDGDGFGGLCEGRSGVGGHVVGTLGVMGPTPLLRSELSHPALEVREHRWVGIFLYQQPCRSVANEHDTQARVDAAVSDDLGDLRRDVEDRLGACRNDQCFLQLPHACKLRWTRSG